VAVQTFSSPPTTFLVIVHLGRLTRYPSKASLLRHTTATFRLRTQAIRGYISVQINQHLITHNHRKIPAPPIFGSLLGLTLQALERYKKSRN